MRPSEARATGILARLIRHKNAANLLMVLMIIFGIWGIYKLNRQFFPDLPTQQVSISVAWSGASAEDIQNNVLVAIEPSVRFLDGVESMTSQAREGSGSISLVFDRSFDMSAAEAAVDAAVRSVSNLPEGVDTPKVSRRPFFDPVAEIGISGPMPEQTLRRYAREIRDGLLDAGLDRVELTGYRSREIQIEVDDLRLQQLDLTLSGISQTLGQNITDRPSGSLSGDFDAQLRAVAPKITPTDLAAIEIKSLPTGEALTVGDVADVTDTFDANQSIGFMRAEPAIKLTVSRSASADTITSYETLLTYVEKLRPTLPPSVKVTVFNAGAELVDGRLSLLINNGVTGLIVVLIILFIFLDARIAFWVAMGIPVSMLATLGIMTITGQSINMISMFAMLMTLGIIVDDAIVVGEHTATRYAAGDPRDIAALKGAGRMAAPVFAASLTTLAAFGPMMLLGGPVGQIMSAMPLVVSAVLIASLVECFLVLPSHLAHALPRERKRPNWFRRGFDAGFEFFRENLIGPAARFTFRWRYATIASVLAFTILGVALIPAGKIKFQFFPTSEGELVSVFANFQPGVPISQMTQIIGDLEAAISKVDADLSGEGESFIATSFADLDVDNGRVNLNIFLTPSETRTVRTNDISQAIRMNTPSVEGIERINVRQQRGRPGGSAIDVKFSGGDAATLKRASEDLQDVLEGFDGVSDVGDTLRYGKPEVVMALTPRGAGLGFTLDSLGTQVRDAFDGRIVSRVATADEEITIRLLRKAGDNGSAAVREFWVRAPQGGFVPLSEIVEFSEQQGFNRLFREEGKTVVSVTADVDQDNYNLAEILTRLETDYLPVIADRHGLNFEIGGSRADQDAAFGDLKMGAIIALAIMYIIISWIFASYAAPIAVMLVIPFGAVGAIWGHYLMGYDLTVISVMGILGLAGILVNDAIVLVSRIQERLGEGESLREAATASSRDRLRAVLLTSLTTIGGLFPLLFEKSLQAQFLIPMAITIVFGLALSTIQVLFVVPAIMGIGEDIGAFFRWLFLTRNHASWRDLLAGRHQDRKHPVVPAE